MASHGPMFVDLDGSGNGMSALDGRRALAGLIGTQVRPVAALPSASQSSSNMQITVAQNVWQVGDVSDSAATFLGAVDAFTVTPAAGPASGTRTDSIVMKADNPKNGDTDPYLTPSLMAGTTSGPPTVAAPFYEVARIAVPAGVSNASGATLTWMQPYALMPLPQQGAAATTLPAGIVPGQRAFVGALEYRWNGATWDLLPLPSMMCHVTYSATSTDPPVSSSGNTNVPNDTVVYDPFNMRQSDGASFVLPWAGRYSFWTRVNFTNDDQTVLYQLTWLNAGGPTSIADWALPYVRGGNPLVGSSELAGFVAGTTVRPAVYRAGGGSQWMQHNIDYAKTLASVIRYLGPN